MLDFRAIEIDFDVHKAIEQERKSFVETPNDVLRRLLKLPSRQNLKAETRPPSGARAWSGEGVTLPHGTDLRMKYNGRQHRGEIVDGKWVVDGRTFESPSGAASGVAITKGGRRTRLDGWNYWEVKLPEDSAWKHISSLRTPTVTLEELGL